VGTDTARFPATLRGAIPAESNFLADSTLPAVILRWAMTGPCDLPCCVKPCSRPLSQLGQVRWSSALMFLNALEGQFLRTAIPLSADRYENSRQRFWHSVIQLHEVVFPFWKLISRSEINCGGTTPSPAPPYPRGRTILSSPACSSCGRDESMLYRRLNPESTATCGRSRINSYNPSTRV